MSTPAADDPQELAPSTQASPPAGTRRAATFAALSNLNFRRFFYGQAVSMIGTWMQSVAQSWLVLELTGSGTALGLVIALQTIPVLFGAPYAGLIADRVDKRRLLVGTQTTMGILALILGVLTVTGSVQLWMVYVLAVALGAANAVDNPTRQAFVLEMVGPAHLRNAVTLNSVLVNAARAIGPAVAGTLIATIGVGICFLVNAGTFVAVIIALATLDRSALLPSPPAPRERGQLREGFAYVRRTPSLVVPLGMMAVIGMLAYEFQVVLPVVARSTFHGGAQAYGFLTAAMGIGAVIGGLGVASRAFTGTRALVWAATIFGGVILLAAAAPNLALACVAMALVGAGSVGFLAIGNATLQLSASPMMRGRVMALWAVAFLGSTPIGGPIAGYVSQHFGGRAGLILGGISCLVAALGGWYVLRRAATRSDGTTQGELNTAEQAPVAA
ncbi:MAG TPA: MFS transporter [Frankiaceae bacterium]|nr:MFS transporter [Frankiaceae bacterium]